MANLDNSVDHYSVLGNPSFLISETERISLKLTMAERRKAGRLRDTFFESSDEIRLLNFHLAKFAKQINKIKLKFEI